MPASPSDQTSAADALGLRRLSQLTAATEGSSALSLTPWASPAQLRVATAATPAALSLVPADAPADIRSLREPSGHSPDWQGRPPVVDDVALREQAHGLAQALVEILAGDRTLTQLVRWTSAEVYEQLHHRVQTLATCPRPAPSSDSTPAARPQRRRRRRPRVASVHVSTPTEGIAEVSARIDHGVRSTALALRLERRSAGRRVAAGGVVQRVPEDRWLCTAVTWA
jgi:hypothetical protein